MDVLTECSIAFGEMSQARDLLTLLLSSSLPTQPTTLPPAPLAATIVDKPSPITSVRAFDAQLTIGGKDKALRAAADLFKTAAEKIEDSRVSGEKYWTDALKIRRDNWGLIPAPLPLGSATGKGADKSSKDFLISFGLEECKSTPYTQECLCIDCAHSTPGVPTTCDWPYGGHGRRPRERP